MLLKLLPVLLAIAGLGAGVGGGMALRPPPEDMAMDNPCGEGPEHKDDEVAQDDKDEAVDATGYDYVKLNNQFVIPVVDDGLVSALVVMSLNLEVMSGQSESIYQLEPKLRDLFLQVLFDHANAGGFTGEFTKTTRMNVLRTALREAAQKMLGQTVSDVLIVDVVRQDV